MALVIFGGPLRLQKGSWGKSGVQRQRWIRVGLRLRMGENAARFVA